VYVAMTLKLTQPSHPIEGLPSVDDSWMIKREHIVFRDEIGKGAFGVVYKADYLGIDVAVKTVGPPGGFQDQMEEIFAHREVAVLKACRHPNIVTFLGILEPEKGNGQSGNQPGFQIVLEYLSKGDLGRFLLDSDEPVSWARKVKLSLDVACGMAYLHARNIIFRDLKSENLLLDDNLKCKICDFGFARSYTKSGRGRPTTMCGTDEFMAPEVVLGQPYDEMADVFSFGMLMFEIISRRDVGKLIPRAVNNNFAINEAEVRSRLPKDCPKHFAELAFLCVKYDPKERPKFTKTIAFLKKLLKVLLETKMKQQGQSAQ